MFVVTTAAVVFGILATIAIAFQLALAFGAPWGDMAMGGKFPGRFPPRLRIAAVFQSILLLLVALIVLTRAEIIFENMIEYSEKAIWFVVVLCAISAIMNAFTPSIKERIIWAPVTLVLFVCAFIVAMS